LRLALPSGEVVLGQEMPLQINLDGDAGFLPFEREQILRTESLAQKDYKAPHFFLPNVTDRTK
jgi:hypothetical protein